MRLTPSLMICNETDGHLTPGDMAGRSGGPVLIAREVNGIVRMEFVGINYEYSEALDVLYILLWCRVRGSAEYVSGKNQAGR